MALYGINLETATHKAYKAVDNIDKHFIGTKDYMGVAWFHAHAYRFVMRDISVAKRKFIHKKLMDAGVTDLSDFTDVISGIIYKHTRSSSCL